MSLIQEFTRRIYILFFLSSFWGAAVVLTTTPYFSLFPARLLGGVANVSHIYLLVANKLSLERGPLLWFLLIWPVYGAISLIWSHDPATGLNTLLNLITSMSLAVLGCWHLGSRQSQRVATKIWLATFAVFACIGMFEHLTTLHLPVSRFAAGQQPHLAYRPTVVFANENNYATFLTLSFPFLLAGFRYFQRTGKLFCAVNLVAGIYLLFVTGSRINYIALVAIIIIYSILLTAKGKRIKTLASLSALVILIFVLTGVVSPLVQGAMLTHLGSLAKVYQELRTFDRHSTYISDNSLAIRFNLARNALHFFLHSYGLGIGPGNFQVYTQAFGLYDTQGIYTPHNWWLELLTEFGIIIFTSYLALYATLVLSCYKAWQQAGTADRWLSEALTLSLSIIPLVSLSPSTFLVFPPHWLLLAMAMGLYSSRQGGETRCAS